MYGRDQKCHDLESVTETLKYFHTKALGRRRLNVIEGIECINGDGTSKHSSTLQS